MARNPYAGIGGDTDPYSNGNGYGAPAPGNEDYDPYGDRYGTPPIVGSSSSRERRQGVNTQRSGGYGNFYENDNGSPPVVQAQSRLEPDPYGNRAEVRTPLRSPRRDPITNYNTSLRTRPERGGVDPLGPGRPADYRRQNQSNGSSNRSDYGGRRNRNDVYVGGEGTRQIEDKHNSFDMAAGARQFWKQLANSSPVVQDKQLSFPASTKSSNSIQSPFSQDNKSSSQAREHLSNSHGRPSKPRLLLDDWVKEPRTARSYAQASQAKRNGMPEHSTEDDSYLETSQFEDSEDSISMSKSATEASRSPRDAARLKAEIFKLFPSTEKRSFEIRSNAHARNLKSWVSVADPLKHLSNSSDAGHTTSPTSPTATRSTTINVEESNRYSSSANNFKDVLQFIQAQWPFMAQDNCIPVQVALQLMDSSSLGLAHQADAFQQAHDQLQRALKAIVNEHHQGFNSSIGTFHKIQSSIQTSQSRVRALKESLAISKKDLSTTRTELKGLATTSQSYDEMIHALAEIEQLRLVTDKLEARISEKRFLSAIDVLQDALRLLRKPELDNIGALSDLRLYLANQETSMTDILIEELHNHLYLRSPYCQDRWKAHAKEQSNGASFEGKDLNTSTIQSLWVFLSEIDLSLPMVEDPARNPESDSFCYIQLLVESLSKMGRLDIAVDSIEQRLPVELFKVVDKTNTEVDQRHPSSFRGNVRSSKGKFDLSVVETDTRAIIIYDLLWTLYAKFEAIAEGHRVFHDVVAGIMKRDGSRGSDAMTGSFKELWKLYQNEIRSLLHDYLATDDDMYRVDQAAKTADSVFKRGQRNKAKKIFSLAETDPKSVEMTTELEELDSILKKSVPGLVSDSRRPAASTTHDNNQSTDGAAGHKLLIEPNVFNMGLLLPPSLGFLHRLRDIVPMDLRETDIKMSTLTSFLDDFLINVFLPQLDDTLSELGQQIIAQGEAFQEDPQWANIAQRPLFRGTSAFFSLITAFCKMLDTIPHDQAFSQLIITQMVTFCDQSTAWYKVLVSRSQASTVYAGDFKVSASFAAGPGEIHDTIQKLWTDEVVDVEDRQLLEKEVGLLILQTNEAPLSPGDIIPDRKTIASLCLLYTSMKWLASKISNLRHITSHDADSSSRQNTKRISYHKRWTQLYDPTKVLDGKSLVYLPMTQDTVMAFDSVVSSFQELAGTILLALHMEIRCQVILSLATAISPPPPPPHSSGGAPSPSHYLLEQAVQEPDPRMLALNADLVAFDQTIATHLRDREADYVRAGLGLLIDGFVVTNAAMLRVVNAHGAARMRLNVLVLQQNLKNIESGAGLGRAAAYFELFGQGPAGVLEQAARQQAEVAAGGGSEGSVAGRRYHDDEQRFSYEELKTLLGLCYSEHLASTERVTSATARRDLDEHLKSLGESMGQD